MKKKLLLSIFAVFIFILTAVPAFAEQSGDWEYELSDVGLMITAYHGSDKDVEIPAEIDGYKVSAIGKQAFKDNTTMTSLVIPEGISKIYAEAFLGCNALSRIEFNAKNCTAVEVQIHDGNKGVGIFSGAGSASPTGLEVVFGDKVAKVPDFLFDTASIDKDYHRGYAYAYVTSVTFSGGVKEIGACAFRGCQDLESVTFGGKEKSIGNDAFYGCKALKELAFTDALTTIGDQAFWGVTSLENISWGNSLDTIGAAAFEGCTSLEKVEFVSPLTTINKHAFLNCTGLKEVLFPESLTYLNAEAFCGCIKLEQVTVNSKNLTVPPIQIHDGNKGIGIFSGAGSASVNGLHVVIGPKVSKVPDFLFDTASIDRDYHRGYDYAYVTSVTFADGVREIGEAAFRSCQTLEKITFSNSIETIGKEAFWGCTALPEMTFGKELITIKEGAFVGDTGLEKIVWGESLETIEAHAFDGCNSLTELHLVNPLTTIGFGAFQNCTALEKLILPETLTSLGGQAFCGCTRLNKVIVLSKNLTVSEVQIHDGRKGVGVFSGAGSGSTSGLEVIIYSGVTKVPAFLFDTASLDRDYHRGYDYAYVTKVTCASTVTEVGDCAFRSCQNLENVHFYSKDVTFGEEAFENCTNRDFHIEGPSGGTLRTNAKDSDFNFTANEDPESLEEIEEPEKADPANLYSPASDKTSGTETEKTGRAKSSTVETGAPDEESAEPASDDTWTCPNGHTGNTGNFCPQCGAKKPE